MRLIQTDFRIRSVQAAILTICMMGLPSQRVGKAQDKQSDTAPQNRNAKPENPLSTDLESLEAQIADAARREAESLMGVIFWDVDSNHFTHRISHTINVLEPNESGVNLIGCCLDTDGNLLAGCAGKNVQEIRVFTPDSERIATWPLPISPLQVDATPNGQIYVAGHEVLLVLDSHGKELLARGCPYLMQAKVEFEKEKAKLKSEISESVEEQLRRFRSWLAELKAKYQELVDREEEQALTDSEQRRQRIYQRSITTLETLIAKQKDESWSDDIVKKLAARVRVRSNVCSLAVTSSRVFLTAPGAAGFGFDIWSGNRDLTAGESSDRG